MSKNRSKKLSMASMTRIAGEVSMSKFQQETAVLLVCNVILFAEFKTTVLGVLMLIFMACFAVMMWRGTND